jgi:hypothetical protein
MEFGANDDLGARADTSDRFEILSPLMCRKERFPQAFHPDA